MYMAISLSTKTFSRRVMLSMAVPGLFANFGCLYMRVFKYREYEFDLAERYQEDIKKYRRFYRDDFKDIDDE